MTGGNLPNRMSLYLQTGVSIILIEQNARMALKLARRAYVLELGSIVLEGAADRLLEDERVKKAYLGCAT